MHRAPFCQLGQPMVSDFLVHQLLRDDANDFPAGREHRVGYQCHQPDARPDARPDVHHPLAAGCQFLAQDPCGSGVLRPGSWAGAAEHTDTAHLPNPIRAERAADGRPLTDPAKGTGCGTA